MKPSTQSLKVLIIDDEETIQSVVKMGLSLSVDWIVVSASSGQEGIEIALKENPDAILLDVMMPEMDGIATFKALQSQPETQEIPVIFLTAKAQTADRQQFQATGVSGVITKPFNSLHLAQQISSLLNW
ncbi:MAG: response regulator [Acaryochloridaceae cyanobacterium RL_2_7]|nr:response regulator [Acaryochloridaceae cyanobacterium RL_2_7]